MATVQCYKGLHFNIFFSVIISLNDAQKSVLLDLILGDDLMTSLIGDICLP